MCVSVYVFVYVHVYVDVLYSPNSANWRGSSFEEKKVWLTYPQLFAPVSNGKHYENQWKTSRFKTVNVKSMKYKQNESYHIKN